MLSLWYACIIDVRLRANGVFHQQKRFDMKKRIAILGGGPAGLALARMILRDHKSEIDLWVLEKRDYVGGLAASFDYKGLIFDFGSHRLHPATNPTILKDMKALLGQDLLDRPRNGRIRLFNKFVKFPLDPFNLALNLPSSFVAGILYDGVSKRFRRQPTNLDSFAEFLLHGLGATVCHNFYFPYARKLWGIDPEKISVEQAERRVSANNFGKIFKKLLSKLPGVSKSKSGRFFYPRKGFGQISEVLASEIRKMDGHILLSSSVNRIFRDDAGKLAVIFRQDPSDHQPVGGDVEQIDHLDFVFSTIPINNLIEYLQPSPPESILSALKEINYRAMVLFYFILKANQFTPFDAHYFPGPDEIFSRLSENKNYYNSRKPEDMTGICMEIPCAVGDAVWSSSDDKLERQILQQLARAQLPITAEIEASFSRRLENVYPIYNIGYEQDYKMASDYLISWPDIISLGRQGLFMHNNTHHSMEMAYRAAECLKPGFIWDHQRWQGYLKEFATFTVED